MEQVSNLGALAVLLIMLGLGQLSAAANQVRGLSLVGPQALLGYGLGGLLLGSGIWLLPPTWLVLWWILPLSLVTFTIMLLGGSFIFPPPHPNQIFAPENPLHGGCQAVTIPDGDHPPIPGLLLTPPHGDLGLAVGIIPGAGDTKVNFKWRLIRALLDQGLTVLTIDPPGHGEYRERIMAYPDCLSAVPATLRFLKNQPNITKVGVIGISLGGAITLGSLAARVEAGDDLTDLLDALVIVATPTHLNYSNRMFYGEAWRTFYRAPVLSLFQEMSAYQMRRAWTTGGYRTNLSTAQLFQALNPLENSKKLKAIATLLVYSRWDSVAPLEMGEAIQQASNADLLESKKASHVLLTLSPEINEAMAKWLRVTLGKD